VEDQLHAEFLQHARYEIVLAHGDAAAENQDLIFIVQPDKGVADPLPVIHQPGTGDVCEVVVKQACLDGAIVGGADLIRLKRLVHSHKLVAGRDDRDARWFGDLDLSAAGAGEHGHFRWSY